MTDKEYEFEDNKHEDDVHEINEYYINRRLQKKQMERKVRQSKMWLGRCRILTRIFILLVLIFMGLKLIKSTQWYLNKNIFKSFHNSSLEIDNNKIVPSYKILNALRRTDIPHVPVYRLETDEIKENILQLDPIENVYIRRFWFPARLQIIVEECTPILSISPELNVAPIAFFTSKGKLIGRDYMPLDKSFKTILVLSYGIKGDDYKSWNKEKIKLIESVAKAVKASSNEEIEYIDVRKPKDVYVKIKTVNVRLGDLDDTVFERIQRIQSILPQVKMLDKKIKYIDLRWKNTNYIKLG
jgi:cell division septal protein FtsQ